MKKLIEIIFERYGELKLMVSVVFVVLFVFLYFNTNHIVFLWIAAPFIIWLSLFILIVIIQAWIIFPISWLISKIKKK